MKYQTLFYRKTMKKYSRLSSAAVLICALRVNNALTYNWTRKKNNMLKSKNSVRFTCNRNIFTDYPRDNQRDREQHALL